MALKRNKLWSIQRKSRYKSTDTWLNSIYKHNKEKIDENLEKPLEGTKRDAFKQMVKEYHDEGLSWRQSVKTYERSTRWTSTAERLQANAYKALTDDREAYRQFREMTKEHGRYTKIDWTRVEWDPVNKGYVYDDRILISFSNSPKQVIVEELEDM